MFDVVLEKGFCLGFSLFLLLFKTVSWAVCDIVIKVTRKCLRLVMGEEKNRVVIDLGNNASEEFFKRDVGISEAVKITGKNKGRISVDSTSGVLKFTVNEKGNRRYKVSDLYQLYGFKNPEKTVSGYDKKRFEDKVEVGLETALLKQKIEHQAEQLRRLEEEICYLRSKQDSLMEQNNRLTLLLPSLAQSNPVSTEQENPSVKRSFWQRLFS